MVFQHASSCINKDGANVNSSSNVLFDSVVVQWNNWGGLNINVSNGVTVRNSIASHNGGNGMGGYQATGTCFSRTMKLPTTIGVEAWATSTIGAWVA